MTKERNATPGTERKAEEKMIREAERGPTAVGQGRGDAESGADSARGMQTGAKDDLTVKTADGNPPAKGKQGEDSERPEGRPRK